MSTIIKRRSKVEATFVENAMTIGWKRLRPRFHPNVEELCAFFYLRITPAFAMATMASGGEGRHWIKSFYLGKHVST